MLLQKRRLSNQTNQLFLLNLRQTFRCILHHEVEVPNPQVSIFTVFFFGESHNPPSNLNQHGWGWVEGKPAPMANSMAPPSQKELTSGFHVTKWKLVFPGFDLSSFVLRRNSTKKHGLQLVQFVYCIFFVIIMFRKNSQTFKFRRLNSKQVT